MNSRVARLKQHISVLCEQERTPRSSGYFKTQEYLRDQIRKTGLEPLTHTFQVSGIGECSNIFAEAGDIQKPRLLIGAHYESHHHSGLAADDNASAVAVLLELMQELPKDLPICFTFFDMEEPYRLRALRGSAAFAKFYDRPLQSVLIMDLVGGAFVPSLENMYFQFGNSTRALEHPELEFFHLPQILLEPFGPWAARSDYHAFRKRGVAFTFLSSGTPWYYHTRFDRPDILRFEKMANLVDAIKERAIGELVLKAESFSLDARQEHFRKTYPKFLRKLYEVEELRTPHLKNLIGLGEDLHAKRRDVLRIYAQLIPKMRKIGPKLWREHKVEATK